MNDVTPLPVPGSVTPEPGVGITIHEREGLVTGTIVRVGQRIFWYRRDYGGVPASLEPATPDTVSRAVLRANGCWRTDDMRFVHVGVRISRTSRAAEPPTASEVDRLAYEVNRLEPSLLKRRWYPMSYMAIPSVLRGADELLASLAAYDGPEKERVEALRQRLTALRRGFRNLGGGLTSDATET